MDMQTRILGDVAETNSVTVVVVTDEQRLYRESRFEYDDVDGMLLALGMLSELANQTIGEWTHIVINFHNA